MSSTTLSLDHLQLCKWLANVVITQQKKKVNPEMTPLSLPISESVAT
jgi:hypothetical protein